MDATGRILFIADRDNNRVRRLTLTTGIITTVVGDGEQRFGGDGGPGSSASLSRPQGVAVDASGGVIVADSANNRVRRLARTGIVATVAGTGVESGSGDGGPGTGASLGAPYAVALDAAGGNVFIGEGGRIRRLSMATGNITTVASAIDG